MPELTLAQLNRATLARQLLLRRERMDVVDAVGHLLALQAQAAPSPYLALWTRLRDFDPADLDRAFDVGDVLKTTLMRTTLHAVTARDHPDLWHAHADVLRRARPGPVLTAALGATEDQISAALATALEHATEARTHGELTAHLAQRHGPVAENGWWWGVAPFARAVRVPDGSVWRFGSPVRFQTAVTSTPEHSVAQSRQVLVRRYLQAFGPATVHDVARFNRMALAVVRPALQACEELVTFDGPDGRTLYDLPDQPLPDPRTKAPPRLLPMWDSMLLAYADRTRVMDDDARALVVRTNGDFLPSVLVDGKVAGLWLPSEDGIEVTAFGDWNAGTWTALEREARSLRRFLAPRDPLVYRRYRHWWAKLPELATRTLA